MLDTIVGTILGVFVSTGSLTALVYCLGQKILALLYDAVKVKISVDIENSKTQFEKVLEQKLKILESKLERTSHAAIEQYDIEIKKYDEISRKLCASTSSVKKMYNISLMKDEIMQAQSMEELRRQVLIDSESFEQAYEEAAPFIRKEIYDIMVQYTQYVNDIEIIHRNNIYGVQQGSVNDIQRAKKLIYEINITKQSIQNSIRSRLEKLEQMVEEL